MTHDTRVGVAVLGSTGSVGRQTLQVLDELAGRFRVVALAARSPSEDFLAQVAHFKPDIVCIGEPARLAEIETREIVTGPDGLQAAATHPEVGIVVVATSGHDAIAPTMEAIRQGKTIALANKETLVCAGELIMPLAAQHGAAIRPVDSEHSAIWQALGNVPLEEVRRIIITASGGPFRTTPRSDLAHVSAREALAHPTWTMGGKITIDSATLMNKGLEVIEARWLFGIPYDRIDVIVHPESVVHSLVEFVDGSQIAQLGLADMRLPIQYALTYPERMARPSCRLSLTDVGALHFEAPDIEHFPSLRIAREAGIAGNSFPTVLSAADEVAVEAFLKDGLRFVDIPRVVQGVLDRHNPVAPLSLESIAASDSWARATARELIAERGMHS
jgi:1-deoxy-D-xylulose-5-phosphate reductoisomerase